MLKKSFFLLLVVFFIFSCSIGVEESATDNISDVNTLSIEENKAVTGGKLKFYRYYNPVTADHLYTTNWREIEGGKYGYEYQWVQCYIYTSGVGRVPFYRYYNSTTGDHFCTANWNELGEGKYGYVYEGIVGYVYLADNDQRVPLYRYFNSSLGNHFYTTYWNELGEGKWGYVYEGIACYVEPYRNEEPWRDLLIEKIRFFDKETGQEVTEKIGKYYKLKAGRWYIIKAYIKNDGDTHINNSFFAKWKERGFNYDESTIPELKAGKTYIAIPESLRHVIPNIYGSIEVIADNRNQVIETNEDNNSMTEYFYIYK